MFSDSRDEFGKPSHYTNLKLSLNIGLFHREERKLCSYKSPVKPDLLPDLLKIRLSLRRLRYLQKIITANLDYCFFIHDNYNRQKQPLGVFYKKTCSLKNRNIHRKTPVLRSLFSKDGLRPATLLKPDSKKVFSYEYCKISRIPFLYNSSWLLNCCKYVIITRHILGYFPNPLHFSNNEKWSLLK